MILTIVQKAENFAEVAHAGQVRKSTGTRYTTHTQKVAQILEDAGFPPEVVSAGHLHDTVEDTIVTIEDIKREFGTYIADLVASNTEEKERDGVPVSWEERKKHTISTAKTNTLEQKALLVADKMANFLEIVADYETMGDDVWKSFKRGKADQYWYFYNVGQSALQNLNETNVPAFFVEYNEVVENFFSKL